MNASDHTPFLKHCYVINIDGIQFWLSNDAIVIPASFNLDDPKAFQALKRAQERFAELQVTVEHLERLSETRLWIKSEYAWADPYTTTEDFVEIIYDYYRDIWRGVANAVLDADIMACEHVLSQKDIEIPKWLPDFKILLRAARISKPNRKSKTTCELPQENPGYVYLIQSVNTHLYKIGKAKDPQNRNRTFGVKLPFEVEMIHTIKCKNYSKAENILHQRYADKRVNGEWFNLSTDEVAEIKAIKRM